MLSSFLGDNRVAALKDHYPHDSDLVAPLDRKEHVFSHESCQPPAECSGREEMPLKATSGSVSQSELIHRLTEMLQYYQEKFPSVNLSSLGTDIRKSARTQPESVLLKAYDEKLKDAESALFALKNDLSKVTERTKDLLGANAAAVVELREEWEGKVTDTQKRMQEMEEKMCIMRQENELLLEQQRNNEENIQKAFSLQRTIPMLQNHITSLRQLSNAQNDSITTLTATNTMLEAQVRELTDRLQATQNRNKELASKCVTWEQRLVYLNETLYKQEKENERLVKWKQEHSGIVSDWESCVQALGLTGLLGDNCLTLSQEGHHFAGILQKHVQKLRVELSETKVVLESKDKEYRTLVKENAVLMQRLIAVDEAKKVENELTQKQIQDLVTSVEQLRHERDAALDSVKDGARDNASLSTKLKETIMKKDSEMAELAASTSHKLKVLNQQYQDELQRMNTEITELRNSKIELQCEIGTLLRDKRAAEFELERCTQRKNIIV